MEVTAAAELAANRKNRIFEAKANLRDQTGLVLATATAKYIPVKGVDAKEMATDFVEDPAWVFEADGPNSAAPSG
jgi:hypothetical protein